MRVGDVRGFPPTIAIQISKGNVATVELAVTAGTWHSPLLGVRRPRRPERARFERFAIGVRAGGFKYNFKYFIYGSVTRIRIENVVASSSLADALDLQSIALGLEGAEYVPDQFPGVIYRLKEPKTAILLFHSGKLVCTGAKSMRQVENSIATIARQIRKLGQRIKTHPKIEVQNIVATSNLEGEINLNSVAITLGLDRIEYEPEQFPGLVCRLKEPRVVVLLFGSGKLVCTGARRPSDVELAVQRITKELQDAGLLRRERDRANSAPTRQSTAIPASVSPGPGPPPKLSRRRRHSSGVRPPILSLSPRHFRRVRSPASKDRVAGSIERRDNVQGGGSTSRSRFPEIHGRYRPLSTPSVSLGCRSW